MNQRREAFCTQSAEGPQGGEWRCGRMPLGYFCGMLLAVLASGLFSLKPVNAELILYISDGTTDLEIRDGDTQYDTDSDIDSISVDINQLENAFGGWNFGAFFGAFTNLTDVDGRPTQILNLEFLATNNTGSAQSLEVLTTFIGSNGRSEGSTVAMFGGASTDQLDSLGYTFVGSYSQDAADELFTNNYSPVDGPNRWVFTAAPLFTDNPFNPGSEDLVLDLGSVPPQDIVGDVTYTMTYGVRVTNLVDGKYFSTQSELDYILPEPASIATWAVAVGLVGLAGKRKRKTRTR